MNGEDNIKFGGGLGESHLHPLILLAMLLAIGLIWTLPRRQVIVPLLATIFLSPFGQQFVVGGMHMYLPRTLIVFSWFRFIRAKLSLTKIDKVFIIWAIYRALAVCLEFLDSHAMVTECGVLMDTLGGYFLLRILIQDEEDIVLVIKTFAVMVCAEASSMIIEKTRNLNPFGYLGGRAIPYFRDGAVRAQGSFGGPIPAGNLGATVFCWLLWLWRRGRSGVLGLAALIGSLIMAVTAASSTSVMGIVAAIVAILLWPLRRNMRWIRWTISLVIITLHLVMKAPVWMLINHLDIIGGNSSYHRAALIDGLIRHFSEWWLIGVKTTKYWGWDMWDQANEFVEEGENGGLVPLVCFISMICMSFGRLGRTRRLVAGSPRQEQLCWALGCSLVAYITIFIGMSFFDQTMYAWFALLAMIVAATQRLDQPTVAHGVPVAEASLGTEDSEWANLLLEPQNSPR